MTERFGDMSGAQCKDGLRWREEGAHNGESRWEGQQKGGGGGKEGGGGGADGRTGRERGGGVD